MTYSFRHIAHIHCDFTEKFAIPRQSGILADNISVIEMDNAYSDPAFVRGLEGFSHLWLLWVFSANDHESHSATVRPPRLGGNARIGVFASRSPYRPNPIGLSSVKLLEIQIKDGKTSLIVSGADLLDQTPILDIKPYLSYTDAHPNATGGFTDTTSFSALSVDVPTDLLQKIPPEKQSTLLAALREDMRPSYQSDPARVYGFSFAGFEVRFSVKDATAHVLSIEKKKESHS